MLAHHCRCWPSTPLRCREDGLHIHKQIHMVGVCVSCFARGHQWSSVGKILHKKHTTAGRPHVRTDSTAPAAVLVKGHPDAVWTAAATHRDTDVRYTPGRSRSRLHRVIYRHTITATNSLCLILGNEAGRPLRNRHCTQNQTHARARALEGSPCALAHKPKKNGQRQRHNRGLPMHRPDDLRRLHT